MFQLNLLFHQKKCSCLKPKHHFDYIDRVNIRENKHPHTPITVKSLYIHHCSAQNLKSRYKHTYLLT